jgi:hypothetical protein
MVVRYYYSANKVMVGDGRRWVMESRVEISQQISFFLASSSDETDASHRR